MKLKNQVRCVKDMECAKAISAYLIADKRGEEVATIHVYHSVTNKGFSHRVDVYENSKEGFAQYRGHTFQTAIQMGSIDGIVMYDSHMTSSETEELLQDYLSSNATKQAYLVKYAKDRGMYFTNPIHGEFQNVYYIAGLDRLECFGYRVHKVL